MNELKKFLFICTHNSTRSQMAEGFTNYFLKNKFFPFSAGTKPIEVNPFDIKVIDEIGIDILKHRSKGVFEFKGEKEVKRENWRYLEK